MTRGEIFLPVSREEMIQRGWYYYDFLVVTADGYIDHPSFGSTLIARLLEAEGYRVAILAQPDWHSAEAFRAMGKPRYGVLIGGGNLDSMVAHYTVAKRRRTRDLYSPGGEMGHRPDRPTIVYTNRAREAFPDTPIVIGGLEASLRRFAHYDYWEDKVRRSILFDAPADLLVYGMGESATAEIARRLAKKTPVQEITDVAGTAYIAADESGCRFHKALCPSYEEVCADKEAYARATKIEYDEHDPIRGCAVLQPCEGRLLVVNPPARPLRREELDRLYDLPYTREVHPMYTAGIPAIEEVRFSITHNRGCFGGCNFCALAFHQGRMVTSRSIESVVEEARLLTEDPQFKGYIHDVGGPSANFRHTSCQKQKKCGMCKNRSCLAPEPCPNLDADHAEYTELLQKLRQLPKIKKVFVRSGIRYDYMLQDKNKDFFRELVQYHISGQLKVAPEHCVSSVLDYMGKPHFDVFLKFWRQYKKLNEQDGTEQYLVPYLMSSHPGCTLSDAVKLAEFLHKNGRTPEQVQDSTPPPAPSPPVCTTPASIPGTCRRCMWPAIPGTRPCSGRCSSGRARKSVRWWWRRWRRRAVPISSATGRSACCAPARANPTASRPPSRRSRSAPPAVPGRRPPETGAAGARPRPASRCRRVKCLPARRKPLPEKGKNNPTGACGSRRLPPFWAVFAACFLFD